MMTNFHVCPRRSGREQAAPTFGTLAEACAAIDVIAPPLERLVRGKWSTVDLADGKHRGAGRVKLYDDGAGGAAFNWVTGQTACWFDGYGRKLTATERRELEARKAQAREDCRREQARLDGVAFNIVGELMERGRLVETHPYLTKKHVRPDSELYLLDADEVNAVVRRHRPELDAFRLWSPKAGAPMAGPVLMAPMRCAGRAALPPRTAEFIDAQGAKCFLKDGRTAGAAWLPTELLNAYSDGEMPMHIGVAEGVATALSIRQMFGVPCVAAMSCGNLARAVRLVRELFPRSALTVYGDQGNGSSEAAQAALAVRPNARLELPCFTDEMRARFRAITGSSKSPTDFNDLLIATEAV